MKKGAPGEKTRGRTAVRLFSFRAGEPALTAAGSGGEKNFYLLCKTVCKSPSLCYN